MGNLPPAARTTPEMPLIVRKKRGWLCLSLSGGELVQKAKELVVESTLLPFERSQSKTPKGRRVKSRSTRIEFIDTAPRFTNRKFVENSKTKPKFSPNARTKRPADTSGFLLSPQPPTHRAH
jgi:hypothetical protein